MVNNTSNHKSNNEQRTTTNGSFVHLHNHSEYSLLDGASRLSTLIARAKELGMPAVALTDHGVMYGTIKFYEEAIKQGIKPIIGCEVYVAQGSRFDRGAGKQDSPNHLTLLAKNNEGYKNLMRLSSAGFLEGFYYKPRIDWEILSQHAEGLVVLSGCLKGYLIELIQQEKEKEAIKLINQYQAVFKDDYYIEIQNQLLEGQVDINKKLAKLAKAQGVGLVATNDTHYVLKEDSVNQDVMLCIQTGTILEDVKRLKFGTQEFYLKNCSEMEQVVGEYPEALDNTVAIAEKCNADLELGKILLPHYKVPKNFSLETYLEKLSYDGLKERYPDAGKEIKDRLKYELDVIKKTGFAGYFLIVWDFVRFAKENKITVGPGRGSAAGSIVSYVLKITNIDPLKNGLLFERFLNPERISMPDIDIDFCYERRNEVIDYVAKKYGSDKVAQIITFGTMAARAATRDAGRVFNIPYGQVDKIAKLIPEMPGTTIEKALATPDLAAQYETDEVTKRIIDTAKSLEGLARQDSIHAAGVVISKDELTNYTPIQRKGDSELTTQYTMEDIQKIGLLKMDFLGLRTLTVVNNAVEIIKNNKGVEIDIDDLPEGDKKTYELLRHGDTIGVFQLESSGMRNLLRELQPTNFEDIVALLALFRPGPLGSGMVKDFVDRKHGLAPSSYLHPILEPIIKETYGIIVYQEQVMQIASTMANFSMSEADILRKAMSKKEPEVLAKIKDKFLKGAKENDIDDKTAGHIFDLVVHFAGYGFNKSHSAAYATISYQTAYLKANYPVEYMAALLTSVGDNKDKVAAFVNECRRLKIKVLPPDVNLSGSGFTAVKDEIRFGLSAVRNVGSNAIETIIKSRQEKGQYKDIYDFSEKVDLSVINKRAMESLIKAGAFDSQGHSRKSLLSVYENAVDIGNKRQKDIKNGQVSFFDLGVETVSAAQNQSLNDEEEMDSRQLLSYEKEMLGLYVSGHPLAGMEGVLNNFSDLALMYLKEQNDGVVKTVAGIVSRISQINTKKGDLMAFLTLEDLGGSVEVVVFPKIYEDKRAILAEDKLLTIKGRIDKKEDDVKIIAMSIEEIDAKSANPANRCLYIKINTDAYNQETISSMRSILASHPGPTPVLLELEDDSGLTKFKFGKEYQVNPQGKLISELRELIGVTAIRTK
ncbi:MAG: DNA polymerase III subunit alpha [Actinobacteria bacterium]|nr:MAG: DNA polymerase III subunit alpha [Actinomycetota bacterium]